MDVSHLDATVEESADVYGVPQTAVARSSGRAEGCPGRVLNMNTAKYDRRRAGSNTAKKSPKGSGANDGACGGHDFAAVDLQM